MACYSWQPHDMSTGGPSLLPVTGLHNQITLWQSEPQEVQLSASFPGVLIDTGVSTFRDNVTGQVYTSPPGYERYPGISGNIAASVTIASQMAPAQRLAGHPYLLGWPTATGGERRGIRLNDVVPRDAVGFSGVISEGAERLTWSWDYPEPGVWNERITRQDWHWSIGFGLDVYDEDQERFDLIVCRASARANQMIYEQLPDGGSAMQLGKISFRLDRAYSLHYPGFFTQGPA